MDVACNGFGRECKVRACRPAAAGTFVVWKLARCSAVHWVLYQEAL
jgi:hypothetical protein